MEIKNTQFFTSQCHRRSIWELRLAWPQKTAPQGQENLQWDLGICIFFLCFKLYR